MNIAPAKLNDEYIYSNAHQLLYMSHVLFKIHPP